MRNIPADRGESLEQGGSVVVVLLGEIFEFFGFPEEIDFCCMAKEALIGW